MKKIQHVCPASMICLLLYLISGCSSRQLSFSFVYVATDNEIGYQDIYLGQYDGANVNSTKLTNDSVWKYFPILSPDGEWVLYKIGEMRTENKLYLFNISKHSITEIQHGGFVIPGSWSPSGESFIYLSDHLEGTYQLFLVNMSDLKPILIPVTAEHKQTIYSVSWSPDEKNLVLGTVPNQYNPDPSLPAVFIYNFEDKKLIPLTTSEHGACKWPSWSPTGEWIVMVCVKSDNGQLYLISPNGTDIKQLTTTPDEIVSSTPPQENFIWLQRPQWLGDGENIVYVASLYFGDTPRLYVTDMNGETHQMILEDQGIVSSISIQAREPR